MVELPIPARVNATHEFSDFFWRENVREVVLIKYDAKFIPVSYTHLDVYKRQLQGNDKAIEALRRIVQAELMGQFYALKYFADDLQREIRYPISEVQEAAWKRNLTLERGPFSAEEADDFYFTMRLGELPHSTCLSCWTGSQRDCLLAAFDSNKKMILIRKGEDIVARACIRLTKGAFQRPADFDFSFADLAQDCLLYTSRCV